MPKKILWRNNEKQKTMKNRITNLLVAAFLTAFLFAGNVKAEGTEVIFVSGLENIVESTLEVEGWMVKEDYWNVSEDTYVYNEYSEEALTLEMWMFNESKWLLNSFEYPLDDTEYKLTLEDWMTSEVYWN